MKSNIRFTIGVVLLFIFVSSSMILPFFTSVNVIEQGTYYKNMPISWEHPLGTNSLGQDLFWWMIFATRNSLLLGVSVSLAAIVLSVAIGLTAGYLGGKTDRVITVITDSFVITPAFPILVVLAGLAKGAGGFFFLGAILAIFGWAFFAKLLRSLALTLREREFINMSRFSGNSIFHILTREIFPYISGYIVVGFINGILGAINTEAGLAALGFSKVEIPTLGSTIFWANTYSAMMMGWYTWIVTPVVVTILLFLALFFTSSGYNEIFATRRGRL